MADTPENRSLKGMEMNTVELPPCVEIKESAILSGQAGAFATTLIPQDTKLGPYKGEIIQAGSKDYIDYRYAWEVYEKDSEIVKFTISALNTKTSNWMRHVNCARFYEEQNILSVQEDFSIFYVAMKDINAGQELLTWFDPKLLKRTKRRQSRGERKNVGYVIEVVPWDDEKKFVPEIIETKRARKKKILSDMISLDLDPVALARTLHSIPVLPSSQKLPAKPAVKAGENGSNNKNPSSLTPRVCVVPLTKNNIHNSVLVKSPATPNTPVTSKTPVTTNTVMPTKTFDQVKKSSVSIISSKKSKKAEQNHLDITDGNPQMVTEMKEKKVFPKGTDRKAGSLKQKKKPGSGKARSRSSVMPAGAESNGQEQDPNVVIFKPVIINRSQDGSVTVEDYDEKYTVRNVAMRNQCDEACFCILGQKCAKQLYDSDSRDDVAVYFNLLPEHKVVLSDGNISFKCDICEGAYNHALSLKRHYLGVHVNHRYISRVDIFSCQIDTFRTDFDLSSLESVTDIDHGSFNNRTQQTSKFSNSQMFVHKENNNGVLFQHISGGLMRMLKDSKITSQRNNLLNPPPLRALAQNAINKNAAGSRVVAHDIGQNLLYNCRSFSASADSAALMQTHPEDKKQPLPLGANVSGIPSALEIFELNPEVSENKHCLNFLASESLDEQKCQRETTQQDSQYVALSESRLSSTTKTVPDAASSNDSCLVVVDQSIAVLPEETLAATASLGIPQINTVATSSPSSCLTPKVTPSVTTTSVFTPGIGSVVTSSSESIPDLSFAVTSSILSIPGISSPAASSPVLQTQVCPSVSLSSLQLCESSSAESYSVLPQISCHVATSSSSSSVESRDTSSEVSLTSSDEKLDSDTYMGGNLNTYDPLTNSSFVLTNIEQSPNISDTFRTVTESSLDILNLTTEKLIETRVDSCVKSSSPHTDLETAQTVALLPQTSKEEDLNTLNTASIAIDNIQRQSKQPLLIVTNIVLPGQPQNLASPVNVPTRQPVPMMLLSHIPPGLNLANVKNHFFQSGSTKPLAVLSLGSKAESQQSISTLNEASQPLVGFDASATTSLPLIIQKHPGQGQLLLKLMQSSQSSLLPAASAPCASSSTVSMRRTPNLAENQPEDLFRCHMCVLVYKTMDQLKQHIKNDPHRFRGGVKQYSCLQCSIRFCSKENLMRHNLMNHAASENFKLRCPTCGKGYNEQSYLNNHARFHSGKNFPCKYGCLNTYFPNAAKLVQHLRNQHAGLNLKDYVQNVKAEIKNKKKLEASLTKKPSTVSRDKKRPKVNKKASVSLVHLNSYNMNQPVLGFQAKRAYPAGFRNTSQHFKHGPLRPEARLNPIVPSASDTATPVSTNRLRYVCQMCMAGFSSHLRLLQHRSKTHGASQSVQEYLHQMSQGGPDEEAASETESFHLDCSPPPSPTTFFRNINRRGSENMNYFIDGSVESLKAHNQKLWREIEAYSCDSWLPKKPAQKLEWTTFNFPPCFEYVEDGTRFYDSEAGTPGQGVSCSSSATSQADTGLRESPSDQFSEPVGSGVSEPVLDLVDPVGQDCLEKAPNCSEVVMQSVEYKGSEDPSEGFKFEKNHNLLQLEPVFSNSDTTPTVDTQTAVQDMEIKSETEEKNVSCRQLPHQEVISICRSIVDSMVSKAVDLLEHKLGDLQDGYGQGSFSRDEIGISVKMQPDEHLGDDNVVMDVLHRPLSQGAEFQAAESNGMKQDTDGIFVKSGDLVAKCKHVFKEMSLLEKCDILKKPSIEALNLEVSKNCPSQNHVSNRGATQDFRSLNSWLMIKALDLGIKDTQIYKYLFKTLSGLKVTLGKPCPESADTKDTQEQGADTSLNSSDPGRHEHRRFSIWSGSASHSLDGSRREVMFCQPVTETVRKQKVMKENEQYQLQKSARDAQLCGKTNKTGQKITFAEQLGLMTRQESELSCHSQRQKEQVIQVPEIWVAYENIWFGKRGTIAVVCSICHRHFSYWDLCLRHQLRKHPHIEPASLEMEKNNCVEDMFYYYPMPFGILAQTHLVPEHIPSPEVYVCTKCSFPFKNLTRLHVHMSSCDSTSLDLGQDPGPSGPNSLITPITFHDKKQAPQIDRQLSQTYRDTNFLTDHKDFNHTSPKTKKACSSENKKKKLFPHTVNHKPLANAGLSKLPNSFTYASYLELKPKISELPYNPQNHVRHRERYKVLEQHQCEGCNLKFQSIYLLEKHVNKCSGKEKLQSQKPLLSGILPDDAAIRKQHTCRYCQKRFTYIKGVDLHYKRICAVRKVKEEENQLTEEDLRHEAELTQIIEHLKWRQALNTDTGDTMTQGQVKVEPSESPPENLQESLSSETLKEDMMVDLKADIGWTALKSQKQEVDDAPKPPGSEMSSPFIKIEHEVGNMDQQMSDVSTLSCDENKELLQSDQRTPETVTSNGLVKKKINRKSAVQSAKSKSRSTSANKRKGSAGNSCVVPKKAKIDLSVSLASDCEINQDLTSHAAKGNVKGKVKELHMDSLPEHPITSKKTNLHVHTTQLSVEGAPTSEEVHSVSADSVSTRKRERSLKSEAGSQEPSIKKKKNDRSVSQKQAKVAISFNKSQARKSLSSPSSNDHERRPPGSTKNKNDPNHVAGRRKSPRNAANMSVTGREPKKNTKKTTKSSLANNDVKPHGAARLDRKRPTVKTRCPSSRPQTGPEPMRPSKNSAGEHRSSQLLNKVKCSSELLKHLTRQESRTTKKASKSQSAINKKSAGSSRAASSLSSRKAAKGRKVLASFNKSIVSTLPTKLNSVTAPVSAMSRRLKTLNKKIISRDENGSKRGACADKRGLSQQRKNSPGSVKTSKTSTSAVLSNSSQPTVKNSVPTSLNLDKSVVSVTVVTLSPNGNNLLTCKSSLPELKESLSVSDTKSISVTSKTSPSRSVSYPAPGYAKPRKQGNPACRISLPSVHSDQAGSCPRDDVKSDIHPDVHPDVHQKAVPVPGDLPASKSVYLSNTTGYYTDVNHTVARQEGDRSKATPVSITCDQDAKTEATDENMGCQLTGNELLNQKKEAMQALIAASPGSDKQICSQKNVANHILASPSQTLPITYGRSIVIHPSPKEQIMSAKVVQVNTAKKPTLVIETNSDKKPAFVVESGSGKKPAFVVESGSDKKPKFVVEYSSDKKPKFVIESGASKRPKFVVESSFDKKPAFVVESSSAKKPIFVIEGGASQVSQNIVNVPGLKTVNVPRPKPVTVQGPPRFVTITKPVAPTQQKDIAGKKQIIVRPVSVRTIGSSLLKSAGIVPVTSGVHVVPISTFNTQKTSPKTIIVPAASLKEQMLTVSTSSTPTFPPYPLRVSPGKGAAPVKLVTVGSTALAKAPLSHTSSAQLRLIGTNKSSLLGTTIVSTQKPVTVHPVQTTPTPNLMPAVITKISVPVKKPEAQIHPPPFLGNSVQPIVKINSHRTLSSGTVSSTSQSGKFNGASFITTLSRPVNSVAAQPQQPPRGGWDANNHVSSTSPAVSCQSLLKKQIMFTLEDGTTATLDSDSLAQLLTVAPPLSKSDLPMPVTPMSDLLVQPVTYDNADLLAQPVNRDKSALFVQPVTHEMPDPFAQPETQEKLDLLVQPATHMSNVLVQQVTQDMSNVLVQQVTHDISDLLVHPSALDHSSSQYATVIESDYQGFGDYNEIDTLSTDLLQDFSSNQQYVYEES